MQSDELKSLLQAAFADARVDVASPDDVHFQACIVSAAFTGKPPLARHRLVYAALGERVGGEIHALTLRTLTPAEAGQA